MNGKKRDAVPFVEAFVTALGFQRYRNRYRKKTEGGIVFEVGLDLCGRPDYLNLPLIFSIFSVEDPKFAPQIGLFDRIILGFDRYAHCEIPSDYVLGMRAHIELFNILADSFDASDV